MRRRISRLLMSGAFVVVVLCLVPETTLAQQEKGDVEIQLQGLVQIGVSEFKSGFGQIFFNVGYFFTRSSEIGGGPSVMISRGGGETHFDAGLNGFYRYNFGGEGAKAFPYLGGDIVLFTVNPPEGVGVLDLTFARPNIGFKYFFKRNVAFDFNAGYGFGVKEPKAGLVDVHLGISFIF